MKLRGDSQIQELDRAMRQATRDRDYGRRDELAARRIERVIALLPEVVSES